MTTSGYQYKMYWVYSEKPSTCPCDIGQNVKMNRAGRFYSLIEATHCVEKLVASNEWDKVVLYNKHNGEVLMKFERRSVLVQTA